MASTLTRIPISQVILRGAELTLGYAERLAQDVPDDKFAHMPHRQMNHAAFCFGHLSIYPNRMFSLLGRDDLVVERAGFPELFKAGVECVEQDGRYPAKSAIMEYYFERHRAILAHLPSVSDEAMAGENPMTGPMKERFPIVGQAINFLANNHQMMHLGQVSAWRRAIGLPPAV